MGVSGCGPAPVGAASPISREVSVLAIINSIASPATLPKILLVSASGCSARAHTVLRRSFQVEPVHAWRQAEIVGLRSTCAVVIADWLCFPRVLRPVRALRRQCAFLPVILVTRKDAENARHLKDVVVEEVVWKAELERDLERAVARLQGQGLLNPIAAELEVAVHIPALLRSALVYACRATPPVLHVEALARTVGCDRSTLHRQWLKVVGESTPARLGEFLDWLLLIRAVALRGSGCKWAAVANELNTHPVTLSRATVRLTGRPLPKIANAGVPPLLDSFRRCVLEPILPPL